MEAEQLNEFKRAERRSAEALAYYMIMGVMSVLGAVIGLAMLVAFALSLWWAIQDVYGRVTVGVFAFIILAGCAVGYVMYRRKT